jgi:hypothetical protein
MNSDLEYIIIRPGGLIGQKESKATDYFISQGDTFKVTPCI